MWKGWERYTGGKERRRSMKGINNGEKRGRAMTI
jgi:hypothetical protein